jgi:hypothetical protein
VGGAVVELDCAARAVSRSWAVRGADVYAWPGGGDRLLVHETGVGIGELDPGTGTWAPGLVPTAALGGEVVDLAAFGDALLAIVSDPAGDYSLACVDLVEGRVAQRLPSESFLFAVDGDGDGEAWVSARLHWNRPAAPTGAFRYDIQTCAPLDGGAPIDTWLAPVRVAFF